MCCCLSPRSVMQRSQWSQVICSATDDVTSIFKLRITPTRWNWNEDQQVPKTKNYINNYNWWTIWELNVMIICIFNVLGNESDSALWWWFWAQGIHESTNNSDFKFHGIICFTQWPEWASRLSSRTADKMKHVNLYERIAGVKKMLNAIFHLHPTMMKLVWSKCDRGWLISMMIVWNINEVLFFSLNIDGFFWQWLQRWERKILGSYGRVACVRHVRDVLL